MADLATFYHVVEQEGYYNKNITIRKKQGRYKNTEVYEWRPSVVSEVSENRWYSVQRDNTVLTTAFEQKNKLLHWRCVREFFNCLLQGHIAIISGHYHRETKTLCVDVQDIQLRKEVINR